MVSSENTISDFYDTHISKIPLINQCLYFMGGLLILKTIFARQRRSVEGFAQEEKFILKENNEIYDEFYCNIYKVIMNDEFRNLYESAKVIRISKMNKKSNVLDIGSGLGEHLQILKRGDIPSLGIELSKAMINKCAEMNPDVDVKHANAMDSMIFETNQFTHILCFFYTLYYMPDQESFLRNCNKWLKYKGSLAVHIVDPDKFHPIVQKNDIFGGMTHELLKPGTRTTKSIVLFEGFEYNAKYIDKDREKLGDVEFEEIFTNSDTRHMRKNSHKMKMLSIPEYESMFKRCGFEIHEKIDLAKARYFYQYVYILKKIN